jgi:hypothetical protein
MLGVEDPEGAEVLPALGQGFLEGLVGKFRAGNLAVPLLKPLFR